MHQVEFYSKLYSCVCSFWTQGIREKPSVLSYPTLSFTPLHFLFLLLFFFSSFSILILLLFLSFSSSTSTHSSIFPSFLLHSLQCLDARKCAIRSESIHNDSIYLSSSIGSSTIFTRRGRVLTSEWSMQQY
jgi:hypothetical protein